MSAERNFYKRIVITTRKSRRIPRNAAVAILGIFVLLLGFVGLVGFPQFSPEIVHAAVVTWDGGGADNNWSTAANWSGDTAPTSSDVATFDSTSTKDATIDANIDVAGIDINTGYTGTITQASSSAITVGTSDYNQADGTFSGDEAATDLNDAFTLSGGTFTSASGTMTVAGSFTVSGSPTFNHNSGTVTFDGNTSQTLSCNNVTFNAVNISKDDGSDRTITINSDCNLPLGANPTVALPRKAMTLNGTLSGTGTLTITNNTSSFGDVNLNSGAVLSGFSALVYNGNSTVNNTFIISGATFDAGSYTTFDLNTASFTLSSGTFTAPSGTMTVAGSFTISGGTFDGNGGTVEFDTTSDPSIDCGSATLAGVKINNSSKDWTLTSNCTVGEFTLTAGTVANPAAARTLSVTGNFAQNAATTFGGANLTVEFSGSAAQDISKTAGTFSSIFSVNKSGSNAASLSTSFTVTTENCNVVDMMDWEIRTVF